VIIIAVILAISTIGIGMLGIENDLGEGDQDGGDGTSEQSTQNIVNISVCKFYDTNATGEFNEDDGDYMIEDWFFQVDIFTETPQPWEKLVNGTTGEDGCITFEVDSDEHYRVREFLPEGWEFTGGNVTGGSADDDDFKLENGAVEITFFDRGEDVELWFGNREKPMEGEITANKFYDTNATGEFNEEDGDEMLEDWTIQLLDENEQLIKENVTGEDGQITFEGLEPGEYYVQEILKEGWVNTTSLKQHVNLTEGEEIELWFGNREIERGNISVYKYHDVEGTGGYDEETDHMLKNWTFNLWNTTEDGERYEMIDTNVTDENGMLVFEDLMPGEYIVEEELKDGWENITSLKQTVILEEGEEAEIWFGNRRIPEVGEITIYKFYDSNVTGEFNDEYDWMLENWTFNLWEAEDGEPVGDPIDTVVTDENGTATFENITSGAYIVEEELKDGWYNTTPLLQPVTVEAGEEYELWFGNVPGGMIEGYKYCDHEMVGDYYEGIEPIEDWTIYLYQEGEQIDYTETDEDGYYMFEDLDPRVENYTVREEDREGWYSVSESMYTFEPTAGFEERFDFFNYRHQNITGIKFYDFTMSGEFEPKEGDIPLRGREVHLYSGNETDGSPIAITETDHHGYYVFGDLEPGEYTVYQPEGCCEWNRTTPREVTVEVGIGCEDEEVNFGEYKLTSIDVYVECGTEGVGVEIYEYESGEVGGLVDSGETGENGSFISEQLEPGYYYVELEDGRSEVVQLRMGEQVEFEEEDDNGENNDSFGSGITKARYNNLK